MSRIGKMPVALPKGVDVKIDGNSVRVKGPKGSLDWEMPVRISARVEDGRISFERGSDSKNDKALHGLARSMVKNMVIGVSEGYKRGLELVGVGYRAQVQGTKIMLSLGYSHPVEFQLPEGITASVDPKQTQLTLTGIDKQKIGQVAADLKALRPPDSYKGKGVRHAGERIKLKAGKAAKK